MHSENNYAKVTQKLRNVLRNSVGIPELSKHYANYAKITQITQVPKNYADYATPTLLMPARRWLRCPMLSAAVASLPDARRGSGNEATAGSSFVAGRS